MNQHTHTAGAAGGAPTEHVVNVNDVIDNATFKPFHWQVLFWCLLIIIFDGYDLVIYGVALPLLMEQWSLTPVEAGMLACWHAGKFGSGRHDVRRDDFWYAGR